MISTYKVKDNMGRLHSILWSDPYCCNYHHKNKGVNTMPKLLTTVRLSQQQINTVESMKGKDFSDKLRSMIDRYDYSELKANELKIINRIQTAKMQHAKIQMALIRALEKVDSLMEDIKSL